MGKNSAIPWTDHTWNPWWGCAKLPHRRACDCCYAHSFAKRVGKNVFGHSVERRIASPKVWNDPLVWNRQAADAIVRPRVFCMSMGDFLEDRPELVEPRERACRIIEETQNLEWLILSKRIENAHLLPWGPGEFPVHVRMGITVEDQGAADRDVPKLLALQCKSFVSIEPMLGPIDFSRVPLDSDNPNIMRGMYNPLVGGGRLTATPWRINWVICGAESAPGKRLGRPLQLDWVRSLRDQCVDAGVPFFYKQGPVNGRLVELPELDGRVWAEVPEVG